MKYTTNKALAVVVLSSIAVFSAQENASILPEEPFSTSVHAPVVPGVTTAEKAARLPPHGTQLIPSSPVTYFNTVEPKISGQTVATMDPLVCTIESGKNNA